MPSFVPRPWKREGIPSTLKSLEEVYHQVRVMTKEQISERYQLSENQAEILYFSLAICRHLLDCTLAKRILCPKVELWDALVRQLLFSKCKGAYDDQVRENAISVRFADGGALRRQPGPRPGHQRLCLKNILTK